ncbi:MULTISPECIES: hypothetical protein [Comamonadaceae]|uniref:hypothetical protein n=1 Tax=Comamonadaceae TaxID=80864 RepID=UPI0001D25DA5|nr:MULTISPECIES: hypothetical protein [Comamonadaceae]EIF28487.1 hypothetical protein BCh11DRAFT_03901 [Burkholderia sp. Ch1-1]MBP3982481.1 hypothetical protein [Acidovorax sp. JG5]QYY24564.1 hypothetical protein K2L43_12715 [Diaphorobacter sp. MNS-0]
MRCDVSTELKELRLHGMAHAWDELTTHEGKPNDVGIGGFAHRNDHTLFYRIRIRRQGQQAWLLLFKGLSHRQGFVFRARSLIGGASEKRKKMCRDQDKTATNAIRGRLALPICR